MMTVTGVAEIRQAQDAASLEMVRGLFLEYAASLGFNLCFQHFEQEVVGLPGKYAAPKGRLLLATVNAQPAGCIAFRPLDAGICEMKRLFVREAFRKSGLGRRLAEEIIAEARLAGYPKMRLDTLPIMDAAIRLYRTLGFQTIAPYYANNLPGAMFFELDLTLGHRQGVSAT